MKRRLLAIAAVLMLAASFISMLTFERLAGRYYTDGVVIVTPRIDDVRYRMHRGWIDGLAPHFPGHTIVGVVRTRSDLTTYYRRATAWVYHHSAGYFALRRAEFIEGTTADAPGEIVMNEALAWQLFGNTRNIAGLEVQLGHGTYVLRGITDIGYEPTAWRIAAAEPVSTLYVRADGHDPLAAATTRHIMSSHLFLNPLNYYITQVDRAVQSMGIRARILLAIVLIGTAAISLLNARRMKMLLFISAISAAALIFTLNAIIAWLPNPEAIDTSLFAYIMRPNSPEQIALLSWRANVGFVAGVMAAVWLGWCCVANFTPHTYQTHNP
jgi:hypothetical protein